MPTNLFEKLPLGRAGIFAMLSALLFILAFTFSAQAQSLTNDVSSSLSLHDRVAEK